MALSEDHSSPLSPRLRAEARKRRRRPNRLPCRAAPHRPPAAANASRARSRSPRRAPIHAFHLLGISGRVCSSCWNEPRSRRSTRRRSGPPPSRWGSPVTAPSRRRTARPQQSRTCGGRWAARTALRIAEGHDVQPVRVLPCLVMTSPRRTARTGRRSATSTSRCRKPGEQADLPSSRGAASARGGAPFPRELVALDGVHGVCGSAMRIPARCSEQTGARAPSNR